MYVLVFCIYISLSLRLHLGFVQKEGARLSFLLPCHGEPKGRGHPEKQAFSEKQAPDHHAASGSS
jgi:hypothetical protein